LTGADDGDDEVEDLKLLSFDTFSDDDEACSFSVILALLAALTVLRLIFVDRVVQR
jgi:hypothetical protein